jgi:integrase
VPVFASEELSALQKACQGRAFGKRRDAAIIAVLTATGIRAGELAGIRCDPHDPRRSDVDLWAREISPKMTYPLVRDLAADGVPVAVTCPLNRRNHPIAK